MNMEVSSTTGTESTPTRTIWRTVCDTSNGRRAAQRAVFSASSKKLPISSKIANQNRPKIWNNDASTPDGAERNSPELLIEAHPNRLRP